MGEAAKRRNFETAGFEMTWAHLKALIDSDLTKKRRLIAHINGDHYVVITGIGQHVKTQPVVKKQVNAQGKEEIVRDEKGRPVVEEKPVLDASGKAVMEEIISYTDPGAGPEGRPWEMKEVSKEEFLKAWQGIIFARAEDAEAIRRLHASDPNLRANPPPGKTEARFELTRPDTQKIRGSFLFWFLPVFLDLALSTGVVYGVTEFVFNDFIEKAGDALDKLIDKTFLGKIKDAFFKLGKNLVEFFNDNLGSVKDLIRVITFAGDPLKEIAGTISKIAKGLISGFVDGDISGALKAAYHELVRELPRVMARVTGLSSLQGLLESLGLSPKVVHYITLAVRITVAVVSMNPALIAATLASIAVEEFGPKLGLSPELTAVLSIAASALGGAVGQSFDPNVTLGQALKAAAPELARAFAQAGAVAIGQAVGLDPRLTALLSTASGAILGNLTDTFVNSSGNIGLRQVFESVKDGVFNEKTFGGLVSVGASIGLDKINVPPVLSNFLPGLIGGLVAGGIGTGAGGGGPPGNLPKDSDSLLKKLGENIQKFGKGIVSGVGKVVSFGQKVLEGAANIIGTAADKLKAGFSTAVDFFSNAFDRKTQETMIHQGGGSIKRFVSNNAVIDGQTARVRFGGADITWDGTNLKVTDDTLTGKFTQTFTDPKINTSTGDFFGKIALAEEIRDGVKVHQTYQDGKLQGVNFLRDNETLLKIRPFDQHTPLSFSNDGSLVNGEAEFGFQFKEVDIPESFLRANQVAGPLPIQPQRTKNSLSDFFHSMSELFNKEGEGYKNFTKQLPKTIDIGKVDKNLTDGAGSAKIAAKLLEAGFEQKDENVGVRGYVVKKKAIVDFLGGEFTAKMDWKKLQFVDFGVKVYAVQTGIEGEHVFGDIVGIKTRLEGTLGSVGVDLAIGKKVKFGLHKGVGYSATVEFFDPNSEEEKKT